MKLKLNLQISVGDIFNMVMKYKNNIWLT